MNSGRDFANGYKSLFVKLPLPISYMAFEIKGALTPAIA